MQWNGKFTIFEKCGTFFDTPFLWLISNCVNFMRKFMETWKVNFSSCNLKNQENIDNWHWMIDLNLIPKSMPAHFYRHIFPFLQSTSKALIDIRKSRRNCWDRKNVSGEHRLKQLGKWVLEDVSEGWKLCRRGQSLGEWRCDLMHPCWGRLLRLSRVSFGQSAKSGACFPNSRVFP